jgi:hypothetical protein
VHSEFGKQVQQVRCERGRLVAGDALGDGPIGQSLDQFPNRGISQDIATSVLNSVP